MRGGTDMATQFSVKDHKSWKARFFTIWGARTLTRQQEG
jgi:hypothetical protein